MKNNERYIYNCEKFVIVQPLWCDANYLDSHKEWSGIKAFKQRRT